MKRLSHAFSNTLRSDILTCVHGALLKYQDCLRKGTSIEVPSAWIYTTARNLVLEFLQNEEKRTRLIITMPHEEMASIADSVTTTYVSSEEALERLTQVSQKAQALPSRLKRLLKVLMLTQAHRPTRTTQRRRRDRERKNAAPSASMIAEGYRRIYGVAPSLSTIARDLEDLRATLRS